MLVRSAGLVTLAGPREDLAEGLVGRAADSPEIGVLGPFDRGVREPFCCLELTSARQDPGLDRVRVDEVDDVPCRARPPRDLRRLERFVVAMLCGKAVRKSHRVRGVVRPLAELVETFDGFPQDLLLSFPIAGGLLDASGPLGRRPVVDEQRPASANGSRPHCIRSRASSKLPSIAAIRPSARESAASTTNPCAAPCQYLELG